MKYFTPEITQNISQYLKTKDNAIKTLEEIEGIEKSLGSEKLNHAEFYEKFTQKLDLYQKEILSFLLDDVLDGKYDKTSLSHLSEEFSEYIKNVEFINVILPFSPSTKFLKDLYSWIIKNFAVNKEFLIVTEVDEKMLMGVRLSYLGKYYDFSLDRKIEEFFKNYKF